MLLMMKNTLRNRYLFSSVYIIVRDYIKCFNRETCPFISNVAKACFYFSIQVVTSL